MNLLVTGGCGFIGSNFVRWQRQHHPEDRIVVLDALTYAGNLHNLDDLQADPGLYFVYGDVCNGPLVESVLRDHAIDAVVHFAAESHVDRSIWGPSVFVQTNIVGTANLLEASRTAKVERFLHISTDEVYGDLGPDDPPFSEETPLRPRSPYAASKAAADHLVLAYVHTYGFPALISRCSNNYGPYQFPEKLIPLMIISALQDQPLPVYGDGSHVRDWIYVLDHCAGLDLILRRGRPGQVYNLGGMCERRNIDIVHAILEILGKPASLIRFVADRPGHDRRYAMDIRRARTELGFEPCCPLEEGLRQTVRWFIDNQAWWQQIQTGEYRGWYQRNYGARLAVEGAVA
ncbi:MAG: dTDP-glucose 4,6-dehydratase [Myxococcales bacterium]|nr:dTDP-glucose 4,6-dehydratase [Myxococcota bacterium]MDW8280337.1 dTDP-glucose 4,6-dehydratase [Myxococcales bacterium]